MAPTSQVAFVQSKVRADNRRHLVESERTPAARLDPKRFFHETTGCGVRKNIT